MIVPLVNEHRVNPTCKPATKTASAITPTHDAWVRVGEVNASHASGPCHVPHPLTFIVVECIVPFTVTTIVAAIFALIPEELGLAEADSTNRMGGTPKPDVVRGVSKGCHALHLTLAGARPGRYACSLVCVTGWLFSQSSTANLELLRTMEDRVSAARATRCEEGAKGATTRQFTYALRRLPVAIGCSAAGTNING